MNLKKGFEASGIKLGTKIIFGTNIFTDTAYEASCLGKKALIVTTSRYLARCGIIANLKNCMEERGITCEISTNISANPKTLEINDIYGLFKNEKIDFVIGIGGGSSIDAAKAVAVSLGNSERNIEEYLRTGKEPPESTLPIVAIPTTAGSGSEVTQAAILTDKKNFLKSGIRGKAIIPSLAAIDPSLSLTVPYEVTKFSGFDVFTHAFESFLSKRSNPASEKISIQTIGIVINVLPQLLKNLNNPELRTQMMFASMLVGVNLLEVGTCLPHRMQYPIGAITDMPHGLGLAILYPAWLKKIKEADIGKLKALDGFFKKYKKYPSDGLTDGVENFLKNLNMDTCLKNKYSMPSDSDIDVLVSRVRGSVENDPVYRPGIIKEIYETSLRGEA